MKTLSFSYNEATIYELLYESLGVSSVPYQGAQVRIVNKVYDKLEQIGQLKDGSDAARGLYTLRYSELPQTVNLEDAEFELLWKAFESTQWNGLGARKAASVYTWFDNLNKTEKANVTGSNIEREA